MHLFPLGCAFHRSAAAFLDAAGKHPYGEPPQIWPAARLAPPPCGRWTSREWIDGSDSFCVRSRRRTRTARPYQPPIGSARHILLESWIRASPIPRAPSAKRFPSLHSIDACAIARPRPRGNLLRRRRPHPIRHHQRSGRPRLVPASKGSVSAGSSALPACMKARWYYIAPLPQARRISVRPAESNRLRPFGPPTPRLAPITRRSASTRFAGN